VVSVLATGPKVRGFKPGQGREDFKGDKIRSTPSFGGEVKPSVPCRRLRHIKEPYEHDRCSLAKFSGRVFHPRFTCSATRWCLPALLTDVPGGRIRWLEPG
jgi:hypothetical protein